MELPNASVLAKFFISQSKKSEKDRANFYFDQFWMSVAEQNGYAYPAAFPEDSDLAAAHNAAFAQLMRDFRGQSK